MVARYNLDRHEAPASYISRAMTSRKPVVVALAIALTMSAANASEVVWPRDSASDLSIYLALQRHRLHADHCSTLLPQLTPKFRSLMQDLDRRVQVIAKVLLASGEYGGMKNRPVPDAIVFALEDTLHDAEHNFERQDAATVCQKKIQTLSELDDDALAMDLSSTLMAVRKMIQNAENEAASKASPE